MCFVLLWLVQMHGVTSAQETQRPRVGLVLSGGSAHGLAHIGVIKYLEEAGVEIDYITGTSMGAVVGGLYAMGYTADQLKDIATGQDWRLLMSNRTPLNEVAPIEKRNHDRIPLSLYWKDDRFEFPSAFIRGQKLDINLSNLFAAAHCVRDFDELYIPFRCVAVDIEDGSVKVFDRGYLADAIRASMAIPSVFPPKLINDRLYVDGGLIRNFPVQEAREMGADIVIGVYVGGVKLEKDRLNSMFDILQQSAFMPGILDADRQAKDVDILIRPDVKDLGKFDFADFDNFYAKGYAAARKKQSAIDSLIRELEAYPAHHRGARLTESDSITVDHILLQEGERGIGKLISNKIKISGRNTFSTSELERSLALIYGTKNFSKSYYTFDTDSMDIDLNILTEDVDPYTLGISLNRFRRYNTSLILNAEARNVLGHLSNFRMDARLSENSGLQAQYYYRLPGRPSLLFRLYGKIETYELPFINRDVIDRLYSYRESDIRAEIVKEWRNTFLFRLGYSYQFDRITPDVFKMDDIKEYQSRRHVFYTGMAYNTLDRQVFPIEGLDINGWINVVTGNHVERADQSASTQFFRHTEDPAYVQAHLWAEFYRSLNPAVCLELGIRGRLSSGTNFLDHYKTGGPPQSKDLTYGFIGLEESEYIMGDHISSRAALRFMYRNTVYISPVVQYMYGRDFLNFAYDRDAQVSMIGFGLQLGIDSPIGPIVFDLGYTNKTEELNLNLGVGFRHIY